MRSNCFIDSHEILRLRSLSCVSVCFNVYGYHTEGLSLYEDSKDLAAGNVRCLEVIEHVLGSMYVPCIVCVGVRRAHVVVTRVGLPK